MTSTDYDLEKHPPELDTNDACHVSTSQMCLPLMPPALGSGYQSPMATLGRQNCLAQAPPLDGGGQNEKARSDVDPFAACNGATGLSNDTTSEPGLVQRQHGAILEGTANATHPNVIAPDSSSWPQGSVHAAAATTTLLSVDALKRDLDDATAVLVYEALTTAIGSTADCLYVELVDSSQ